MSHEKYLDYILASIRDYAECIEDTGNEIQKILGDFRKISELNIEFDKIDQFFITLDTDKQNIDNFFNGMLREIKDESGANRVQELKSQFEALKQRHTYEYNMYSEFRKTLEKRKPFPQTQLNHIVGSGDKKPYSPQTIGIPTARPFLPPPIDESEVKVVKPQEGDGKPKTFAEITRGLRQVTSSQHQ